MVLIRLHAIRPNVLTALIATDALRLLMIAVTLLEHAMRHATRHAINLATRLATRSARRQRAATRNARSMVTSSAARRRQVATAHALTARRLNNGRFFPSDIL